MKKQRDRTVLKIAPSKPGNSKGRWIQQHFRQEKKVKGYFFVHRYRRGKLLLKDYKLNPLLCIIHDK